MRTVLKIRPKVYVDIYEAERDANLLNSGESNSEDAFTFVVVGNEIDKYLIEVYDQDNLFINYWGTIT